MACKVWYGGHRNALDKLRTSDFLRRNYGVLTSTTITSATPDGVLGGMVTVTTASREVGVYSGSGIPRGIFVKSSAGEPFENTPAAASEKVTFCIGNGSYEADIYETADSLGDLVYSAGDALYASSNGLLTNSLESSGSGIVAVCTKVPTASDPWLGFDWLA